MRIRLVTAVWGQEYVDTFVRVGLRSLLSQGNIPDLAVEHEVLYTIYTMQPDAQTLERAPAFARLRESANVSLSLFDPREIDTTNYGEHGTFWWRAIDLARRNGEVLFFIIPDLLMRALFVRGNFGIDAADQAAYALSAYGLGLPAFVLLRCVTPSFYARGDTATPVRATLASVAANIAMKFAFVMGLDLGVFGLAVATSLSAWINLGVLTYLARRRSVLVATPELKRGLFPVFAAAIAAGIGFFAGDALSQSLLGPAGGFRELIAFVIAGSAGAAAFALVVVSFRRNLPLGAR